MSRSFALSKAQNTALRIAAVLWVIWGLVHMLGGSIVIPSDASGGFQAIADAVPADQLEADYHAAVNGVLDQHGWNLLWGGFVTIIGGLFIWRGNMTAIWVTAMIGGLLDIGYLVFVDLPGYVKFFPGTLMTVVSATAIVLSFWVWLALRKRTANN